VVVCAWSSNYHRKHMKDDHHPGHIWVKIWDPIFSLALLQQRWILKVESWGQHRMLFTHPYLCLDSKTKHICIQIPTFQLPHLIQNSIFFPSAGMRGNLKLITPTVKWTSGSKYRSGLWISWWALKLSLLPASIQKGTDPVDEIYHRRRGTWANPSS
jgi:hypothetical protein